MSITFPSGFLASGVKAGIKSSGQPDVALVLNQGPLTVAAGVFTSNRVVAAPVVLSRQKLHDNQAQAVILNSGCANACTGEPGFADAVSTVNHMAEALQLDADQVLVCSTGMIGERLPMPALLGGVEKAARKLSAQGGEAAATAIMTTDTHPKQAQFSGEGWSVGGMIKGAGMLAPGLATMLCVITTDAVIEAEVAQRALAAATRISLDRVDSDGCMSTNDSVILLASGASGIEVSEDEFAASLAEVCLDLGQQLIADAEGASHNIAIRVFNAISEDAAVLAARTIARSNLFKTAVFGNDPNWGRILSALGTVPAEVVPYNPAEIDVCINGVMVCRSGGVGDDRDLVDMTERDVKIEIDLHAGDAAATVLTNDLTHAYIHENSAYSS